MAFDTNWNIDKYKSPFESEEHWELRRSFLVAHKSKYPEDQLVCLAQVFFNIELLGCRYPQETMDLVSELAEGIADDYRGKKQQKLQRTFVKASDAAGARLKGNDEIQLIPRGKQLDPKMAAVSDFTRNLPIPTSSTTSTSTTSAQSNIEKSLPKSSELIGNLQSKNPEIISVSVSDQFHSIVNKYFQDFIIMKKVDENFFEHGSSVLQRSLAKTSIAPKFEFSSKGTLPDLEWECTLSVNEVATAYAVAKTKIISRKAAVEILLFKLQDFCFTIDEKKRFISDGSTVEKSTNAQSEKETPGSSTMENNVGSKIMKMMGWKGGGLGKAEQGISSPVTVQDRVQRSGFGMNLTESELMKKLQHKLDTYAKTSTNYDLVFSSDFSKEERAKLHQMAMKFHLKTRSYGKGNDRHLVVSKASNQQSIIETLMNCGGENEKYKLIPPTNF